MPSALRVVADRPKRVALVVRVSTDRQARNDEGSLKTQLQRLRAHLDYKQASGENWTEASVYELRAISGKHSLQSAEMQRLMADIRAGRVNTVCCTALDRVSRSVTDFLQFIQFLADQDVEFVCLKQQVDTTSPHGKLLLTMLIALAQFEREMTSERTRDAVAARSERGLWNGGRILGFDLDAERKGYLLVNELEAEAVRFAFETYIARGAFSETAAALNERGYRTKAYQSRRGTAHPGVPFRLTTVQYLLKNVAYIGKKAVKTPNGETALVDAVWPAIIDQALFDEAQRLMATNNRANGNRAKTLKHTYALNAGLLWCGACGAPMEGRSGTGRLGQRYYYYACKNRDCNLRVVADEIEDAVLDRIGVLAREEGLLRDIVAATNQRLQRQRPSLIRRRRAHQRDLKAVKAETDRLLLGWSSFHGTEAQTAATTKLGELSDRRSQLDLALAEVDDALRAVERTNVDAEIVRIALDQIRRVYDHLKPFEQQELVRLVLQRAEVSEHRLLLEIKTSACATLAQAPNVADLDGKRFPLPERLPEQNSNPQPASPVSR
jgi:site-specific DNA recombinase